MVIFYLFIIILALWGIIVRNGIEQKNYLSKDSTNAIKGICILLVFLRHANQYINDSGYDYTCFGDSLFLTIDGLLDQLIVVMFLFFSGYGVFSSILKRGYSYIINIPRHRVLNTLLNFDVAVVAFFVVALIVGRELTWGKVLLSLFAWESIGCSNWYIFVILLCYLSTWLVYSVGNYSDKFVSADINNIRIVSVFCLLIVVAVILALLGKGQWWYNTIFVYPLGMLYGQYQKKFESLVIRKANYCLIFLGSLSCFFISYLPDYLNILNFPGASWGGWILRVISAISLTLLMMMRIEIGNKAVIWLGVNLFPLYIYQRLPMIVISTFITTNPYVLIPLSFLITILIVPLFNRYKVKL